MRWKIIPKFPRYEVSESGIIRTRWARTCSPAKKVIKQRLNLHGRPQVILQEMGCIKTLHVAPIVASAFLGPKPHGKEVNHKDGNKENNHWSNLEYVTRKENVAHAIRLGLRPVGERHWMSKLREEDVLWIRTETDFSEGYMAKRLGVSRATISNVKHRKTWRHVQDE